VLGWARVFTILLVQQASLHASAWPTAELPALQPAAPPAWLVMETRVSTAVLPALPWLTLYGMHASPTLPRVPA